VSASSPAITSVGVDIMQGGNGYERRNRRCSSRDSDQKLGCWEFALARLGLSALQMNAGSHEIRFSELSIDLQI